MIVSFCCCSGQSEEKEKEKESRGSFRSVSWNIFKMHTSQVLNQSKSKVFLLFLVNGEHKKTSKRPLTDAAVQQPKRRRTNKDAEEEVRSHIRSFLRKNQLMLIYQNTRLKCE